jgi:hypothetical protein
VAPQEDLGHDVVGSIRAKTDVVGLELVDVAVLDLQLVLLLERDKAMREFDRAQCGQELEVELPEWGCQWTSLGCGRGPIKLDIL